VAWLPESVKVLNPMEKVITGKLLEKQVKRLVLNGVGVGKVFQTDPIFRYLV